MLVESGIARKAPLLYRAWPHVGESISLAERSRQRRSKKSTVSDSSNDAAVGAWTRNALARTLSQVERAREHGRYRS